MNDKKEIGGSQHGFMKWKSCLTSLGAFYHEITTFMEEGKAVDVVYLVTKAFKTAPH